MAIISFNPDGWVTRTAGFPRIVQSILFDISLHNWRTGTAMSLAHYQIITADLGQEQAMNIADMLLQAGKIEQGDDGSIWSPDAVEEWAKAEKIRAAKSRGGQAKPAPKAKPIAPKRPAAQPVARIKREVTPAPPSAEEVAAAEKVLSVQNAAAQLAANVERLAEEWNAMASACGAPQIERMTESRVAAARSRIKEYGIERLAEQLRKIPETVLLKGKGVTFDWFLRPETCGKLAAGAFDKREDGA